MANRDRDWDFHLRTLSNSSRDSNFAGDPAADPSLLHSVKRLYELCKAEKSEDLVARVYPQINRLFQRAVASLPQSRSSYGILLLEILQFYLDFGDIVLHDADPSLRTFFKSCLSREFAEPVVAKATLDFLNANSEKLLLSFPTLLPQFFPLLLKLIVWNGEKLEKSFTKIFPILMSPGCFLPLFTSVVDLPVLVVALEKVERSSGPLVGSSIASIQKSTAPEMLLALMDEAYTGSTIGDGGADSESDDNNTIESANPLFLDLLKDENDGLVERHWTSPGVIAALQAAIHSPQSDRLKQACNISPRLLDVYFPIALREVNDSLLCALISLLMTRTSTLFPDKKFQYEVQKRLLEFMLASFQRSPSIVAMLKKPIMNRLGEAYDSSAKTELALQLCWAIGEHAGGGASYKDAARELFESLELLLYENLSSSRLGLRQEATVDEASKKSCQSRLLCFVVTAIAKLASFHRELLPRARVSLGKVARSRNLDVRVWQRARDYLGLLMEPSVSVSVLGPSHSSDESPGVVNWKKEGSRRMTAHLPFYILRDQEGPPFHDFSFSDILSAS